MALAIDSQEASNAGHRLASGTPLTWSFTNTAGNLLVVGVVVTQASGTAPTPTVTYNGVSMGTAIVSIAWGTTASLALLFALASPATGANTVSVAPGSGGHSTLAGAISFSGANTSTPTGTTSSAQFAGTDGTHAQAGNITATSGNYVIGVGGWGAGTTATADSGQSATFKLVGASDTGGDDICCVVQQSSGSAINAGFTWSPADQWGIVAAEIVAAAGAAAVLPELVMAPPIPAARSR